MRSIVFIIPYFGRFHNYFQLWLNSCAANPTVDWLIFTDDKRLFIYPDNVHVIYTTLQEVKNRVENTFHMSVWLEHAYKLCDLKPLYGMIFKNELRGYDFWGYCDVDLIWGDIREFVTDELLEKYYRIFQYGHCTLMKNIDIITEFYNRDVFGMLDYRTVLQSPLNYAFDEDKLWGCNVAFDQLFKTRFFKDNPAYDINVKKKKFYPADSMVREKTKVLFEYDNGKVYGHEKKDGGLVKQEYLYVHLQKREMKLSIRSVADSHYLIVPNRFIACSDVVLDIRLFEKLQPFSSFYAHEWKRKLKKLRNAFFDDSMIKDASRNKLEHCLDELLDRKGYLWRT